VDGVRSIIPDSPTTATTTGTATLLAPALASARPALASARPAESTVLVEVEISRIKAAVLTEVEVPAGPESTISPHAKVPRPVESAVLAEIETSPGRSAVHHRERRWPFVLLIFRVRNFGITAGHLIHLASFGFVRVLARSFWSRRRASIFGSVGRAGSRVSRVR
jgi:hypothetical protein